MDDDFLVLCQEALDAVDCADSISAAARSLGIPAGTLRHRLRRAQDQDLVPRPISVESDFALPIFDDDDISAPEILDQMERRFEKKLAYEQSQRWFPIKIRSDDPVGLAVVGDPHLGQSCNIPLLKRDVRIMSETEGMMALNMGDTADNWSYGRLLQLYSEEDISRPTEQRLARWFLRDAKIPWILWLHGNHEMMHSEFSTYLKTINVDQIPMIEWRARFKLVFPSLEIKIDAAHDHKGSSIYNIMHGQKRAALWDEDADIYVAGHRHTWGLSTEELDDGRVVFFGRARGYKFLDRYAVRRGYHNDKYGATVLFVIDPQDTNPASRIHSFVDLEQGAEYLEWKRAKRA
jgi:hypothetical protein